LLAPQVAGADRGELAGDSGVTDGDGWGGVTLAQRALAAQARHHPRPARRLHVWCSMEFGVFQAHGDPYETLVLLHHPHVRAQLSPLGRGTSSSRRWIEPGDLFGVYAPLIDASRLREQANALRVALGHLRRASTTAAEIYTTIGG
jgi:hypothetical protein